MDNKAVKKMGHLKIQKSSQLTRNFHEQKFLRFLRRLQWLLFEKNWINVMEDRDSQFYSWSRHFFANLDIFIAN